MRAKATPGKPPGTFFSGILIEITNHKTVEQYRNHFTYVLSRQVSLPVNTVKKRLTTVKKHLKEENQIEEQVDKSLQELAYAHDVLTDLKDFSDIVDGKMTFESRHFNLTRLLKEVSEDISLHSATHDVLFKNNLSDVRFLGDSYRIRQLLFIVLDNAVKYSPKATEVVMEAGLEPQSGEVLIKIKDYGLGMDKRYTDFIFDQFYRGPNEYNDHIEGLGLGLFLAKRIVEFHNGRIWFESKAGQGSTFFIALPTKKVKFERRYELSLMN